MYVFILLGNYKNLTKLYFHVRLFFVGQSELMFCVVTHIWLSDKLFLIFFYVIAVFWVDRKHEIIGGSCAHHPRTGEKIPELQHELWISLSSQHKAPGEWVR